MIVHIAKGVSKRVDTYRGARAVILEYWDGQGSTAFYSDHVAGFIEDGGEIVAHVSFNGRVWEGAQRFASNKVEISLDSIAAGGGS